MLVKSLEIQYHLLLIGVLSCTVCLQNVVLEGVTSEEGHIFYEQLRLQIGTFKIGKT